MIRHEIYRDLRLRSTFTAMWRGFLITGREGGGFFGRTKATILDFEKKKKKKNGGRERLKSPFVSKLENAEALVSGRERSSPLVELCFHVGEERKDTRVGAE